MANVNLALEDIITTQKVRGGNRRVGGGGGGARRSVGGGFSRGGGRFARDKYFSDDTPAGKWKHDKFAEVYGGGKKRGGVVSSASGGARRPAGRVGGAASEILKLNISNLPDTVLTADLEELFQDFGVYGVTVHYDEAGQHLGTADLFVDFYSAKDIMREYANIAIDGQEIRIAVVDETGGLKPRIKDRIQRVANNPIRQRRAQVQRRSSPGKRTGGTGRISKGGPKPGGAKLKQMSAEELDKELELYMGSRNGGGD